MEENEEIEEQEQALPQYYVDTDEFGSIVGFYVDTIHGENIPETAMTITIEEWQTYSADASLYKRDGETIRAKTQQELDDEAAARPVPPPHPMDVLGQQLVEKELQILDLQAQNNMLGGSLVAMELRLLALEGGASA